LLNHLFSSIESLGVTVQKSGNEVMQTLDLDNTIYF